MKRFFKIIFLTSLFLIGLVYILLQSSPVQNYIIEKLTSSFEKKLGTKVRIGHIDIDFFHAVRLDDIIFCDLHGDTVLFSKSLKLDISDLNVSQRKIRINYILLEEANIKLLRHEQDRRWAYLMLLDNFKTKKKSTTSSQPDWIIEVDEIVLDDCRFQYEDRHAGHRINEFDEDHIQLSQLSASITDLRIEGDSTKMKISKLTTSDQCGFKISELNSLLTISSNEMNFSELKIITPFSEIKDQFIMRFDSIEDFDDFLSRVKIEAHIDKSTVSFDDLRFFSYDLTGMHQKIILSGIGKGTIDNLKCKNVIASFGNASYFKGNVSVKGLPDVYETFFDISTKDALLNRDDLEYLIGTDLPDEVNKLGTIYYQMKAIGFMRDFVLDGSFNTAVGKIKTDLNLKFPKDKIESYSGTAYLNEFNLGKLTGNSMVEDLSGSLTVKGSGLTIKTITTKIDANLTSLRFNNYTYKNITATGTIANKLFTGKAIVTDENLNLDFDGTIDYSKPESIFDFDAKIKNANLHTLNLDSSYSILNTQVQMRLHGNNIENIHGGATIPYISYKRGNKDYEFKNLKLTSTILANKRSINVTSDVIDASIDGNYNFNDLVDAVKNEGNLLYPEYFNHYDNISNQDFLFKINLKKPEEFIALLDPKLNLKTTYIDGYFNNTTHNYALNLRSNQIKYDNLLFDTVYLKSSRNPNEPLLINISTKSIGQLNSAPWVTHDSINLICNLNKIEGSIIAYDNHTGNNLKVESIVDFFKEGIAIKLNKSGGEFSNIDFSFKHNEPLFLNEDGLRFFNFTISNNNQEAVLNGRLSNNPDDQITIGIHRFQLSTINMLIKNLDVDLFGEVNGNLSITNPLNNPFFATDSSGITVKTFQVDKDTFGNLKIISAFSKNENIISTNVKFTDGDLQNLEIDGRIFPNKKTNYLDFDIRMKETPFKVLGFVFKDIASDLDGQLTGTAKLTGTFDKPEINGMAHLKNGGFTVDYLRTHYTFEDDIKITKNSFEFDNVKIYDENKRVATANGKVTHKNFGAWAIDISVKDFSNYKILNTNNRDNDLFYGIGYASGSISMFGDIDNIKMVMYLKSNRGTLINIPLSNPEYSSKSSYITFKDKTQKTSKTYKVMLSGLELDMHLDINEDAYIKLIFDSQLGDIIEGTGNGNLRMNISPTGDFSMYGYYEIVHGKYLFTKFDVFNKPFIVKNGGRITWDGDPYAAKVNLEAVYNISQANASSLIQSQGIGNNSDQAYIPVDCILFLKGLLFKPDITFNLEIPKLQNFANPQLENTVKTYIASWQQNPDELNRQVFSLLFFKRFFPLENSAIGFTPQAGGYTALGDLLTAQLTNWLGQVFTNNPFGFDYNKTDPNRTGIWIFKLSKKFFNDRLVLEGNYILDGEQSSNVTGNLSAQVLIDKTGDVRFTVFSKRANNTFTYNQNVLTTGMGFYWHKEFNSFRRRKKITTFPNNTSSSSPL